MKTRQISTTQERTCGQFVLIAKSVKCGAIQVSLIDTSDSNPLMWSLPINNTDAVELIEAFEKYGYSKKFKELIEKFVKELIGEC